MKVGMFSVVGAVVALAGLFAPGSAVATAKPKLVSVTVAPASATMPRGGYTQQFTATGRYSDGSSANLTTAVSWKSSDAAVATVDAVGTALSGATAGSATITARTTSGKKITGSAAVTVTAVTLSTLTITPESPYIDPLYLAKGDAAKLDAIGHFSDGSTFDISADVTWTSNSLSKATVDSVGHVTAVATGTATITARKGTTISDTIPVNVSDAELRSVEVQPDQWSMTVGGALVQLQAVGHFSDGSEATLTLSPDTAWSSSAPEVADVNDTSAKGLVTAVSLGVATISATVTATVVIPDGTPTQVEVFGTASIEVQS